MIFRNMLPSEIFLKPCPSTIMDDGTLSILVQLGNLIYDERKEEAYACTRCLT